MNNFPNRSEFLTLREPSHEVDSFFSNDATKTDTKDPFEILNIQDDEENQPANISSVVDELDKQNSAHNDNKTINAKLINTEFVSNKGPGDKLTKFFTPNGGSPFEFGLADNDNNSDNKLELPSGGRSNGSIQQEDNQRKINDFRLRYQNPKEIKSVQSLKNQNGKLKAQSIEETYLHSSNKRVRKDPDFSNCQQATSTRESDQPVSILQQPSSNLPTKKLLNNSKKQQKKNKNNQKAASLNSSSLCERNSSAKEYQPSVGHCFEGSNYLSNINPNSNCHSNNTTSSQRIDNTPNTINFTHPSMQMDLVPKFETKPYAQVSINLVQIPESDTNFEENCKSLFCFLRVGFASIPRKPKEPFKWSNIKIPIEEEDRFEVFMAHFQKKLMKNTWKDIQKIIARTDMHGKFTGYFIDIIKEFFEERNSEHFNIWKFSKNFVNEEKHDFFEKVCAKLEELVQNQTRINLWLISIIYYKAFIYNNSRILR